MNISLIQFLNSMFFLVQSIKSCFLVQNAGLECCCEFGLEPCQLQNVESF